jgi:AAA family ATP:ADP antiporter
VFLKGEIMSKPTPTAQEFGKIRAALFPIHSHELKKFLPMGFMMFFILFNYTILRDTKDALLGTAPNSSTEAFNFVKLGIVMPLAVLFVVLYAKLANIFSRYQLFNIMIATFISFFGIFAFVIYPNIESFHPDVNYIASLQAEFPRWHYPIAIYGNWTFTIFYATSELWGSAMISLLFWQFANEITRTREAKRFYALFGLLANIALIFSGQTVKYMSDIRHSLPEGVDAWGVSLKYMMTAVVLAGFCVIFINYWMEKNVLNDPRFYDAAESAGKKKKKKKPKLSISESFKYLLTSPYIGMIAILVLSYGMSINLIEFLWKKQIKLYYAGDPNAYSAFMGNFSTFTGISTMILIMLCKGIVRKFGWLTGAVITPAAVAITGGLFFAFLLFSDITSPILAGIGVGVTYAAMMVGAVQNILSKGTKYSLFDPTKEMSYIPLDAELKTKGKAAVDVIGGRLGKAGGGLVSSGLLTILGVSEAILIAPYLAVIVSIVIFAWFWAARNLSKKYNAAIAEQEQDSQKV